MATAEDILHGPPADPISAGNTAVIILTEEIHRTRATTAMEAGRLTEMITADRITGTALKVVGTHGNHPDRTMAMATATELTSDLMKGGTLLTVPVPGATAVKAALQGATPMAIRVVIPAKEGNTETAIQTMVTSQGIQVASLRIPHHRGIHPPAVRKKISPDFQEKSFFLV